MSNKIIKASAGSGKTFQLSNEFLNIILRADGGRTGEQVGSILASTFTRKAAGEILDRILTRLAEAALDKKKQKELAQHVPLPSNDTTKLLQQTTAELAKNLYRLRICTLDSFFNKIADSFALELGLPPGWTIMDETEYQRSIHEAIQEVFEESNKNEARKLLHLLQKGEEERNITQEIVGLAKDFLPLVRSTETSHWDHTDANRLGTLTHGKMTEETFVQTIEPFAENRAALHQILPKTKKGEPDGNCVKDINAFMELVEKRNWEAMLTTKIGNNFALGSFVFRNKPVEPELCDFLYPIVQHAKAVLLETVIHQTIATRSLLDLVWEKLEAILLRKRGFRFEDITFCLGDLFRRKPNVLPQRLLAHRMDAPTEHLLLDEFQDTSLSQWSILQPFVQSVNKGTNTSFFCVGDLKQAIYSWRGGVAEIFETVNDFLEQDGTASPETPVMNETRRNSQAVIDTVNQVFLHIGMNTAVCDKSAVAAAKWQEWFGENKHETLSAGKDKGYCVLEAAPVESTTDNESRERSNAQRPDSDDNDTDIDTEKPFWKYTLNRIGQLHQKHPNRSIGILFRAGTNIPTLLKGLKVRGIEASDEGGVPLTDSAAVQQVLSVMTLIDHPGDTIVRFHLANGPLADMLSLWDYEDTVAAEKMAHHWRAKLLSQGYGKTVKELMSALTPCEPKEMQRLEKLLELAYRFDEQATGTRTRQFIEAVNAARLATPSADSIRVMTIHRAKGLEFDIVVLPDLEGDLVGRRPKVIVSQDSPTAPVNFVLRWMDNDLIPLLPESYQQAFVQWQDNQVKESLAVLYVAMTRARHELVMIVPEKSRRRTGTYSAVLRSGLSVAEKNESILYQTGNEDWDDGIADATSELPSVVWSGLAQRTCLRNLPRDTPSGRTRTDGKLAPSSREGTKESPETAALRGTAIHACFASVRWLDMEAGSAAQRSDRINPANDPVAARCCAPGFQTTLQTIVEQAIAGNRKTLNPSEIVGDFLSMCEQSEVRKVLLRSSYPAEEKIEVETERRFAVRRENKILHGSMDRLVIRRKGNKEVGLEIFDFKTDRPGGESVSEFLLERQQNYAPQMAAYRQAAEKLYPNVRDITTKIVFTAVNKVVSMG